MSNLQCVACDSERFESYIHCEDINTQQNILKCQSCGLVFFENGNGKLDNSYWDSQKHLNLYEEEQIEKGFRSEFMRRISMINAQKNKGRLLDIGCGLGYFLNLAQNDGWQVNGVEIAPSAAAYAREKFSLDVYEGTVEGYQARDDSFDVVTMWDVIEHIQNPEESLSAIKRKIKSGGLLVIKTPDERSLFKTMARAAYFLSRRKISLFLKYVYYLPHYFYYNKKTIKKILEKFGFRVIRIDSEETDYNFAKKKIKLHYNKFISKGLILLGLPLIYLFARIFRNQNKMIIYALKS